MKVAVVGAGIVGASAARFLAQRGHCVTVHEQFPLGHARGSSHGRSRIVRRAYPDPFWTACMNEAYPMWAELEAESGERLVDECGLLYFGARDGERIRSMIAGLSDLGVPNEVLAATEVGRVLPELRLGSEEVGVFTPEAGWVAADWALAATLRLAERHGAQFRTAAQVDLDSLRRDHDAVVVAPGPWIREFVAVPVTVTLQTFGYVEAQVGGPVWIDDENLTYGFPSDATGLKIGVHPPGPAIDPNDSSREPQSEAVEIIRDQARLRFGVLDPKVVDARGCLYTWTADEDFLLGRIGDGVFFASACSGHGFKLAPWVGRLLADFVEATDAPERHPRFAFTPETG